LIALSICKKNDPEYSGVCDFARQVYRERHGTELEVFPEVFSTAYYEGSLVGCFGLFSGEEHDPLTFETYFRFDALERLSDGKVSDRCFLGELGMRCVETKILDAQNEEQWSFLVSAGLSGTLILEAERLGFVHLAFTANRTVRAIARFLRVRMTELGEPDLSLKTPEYLENWKSFFSVPQICFGIGVAQTVPGCQAGLSKLETEHGFLLWKPES